MSRKKPPYVVEVDTNRSPLLVFNRVEVYTHIHLHNASATDIQTAVDDALTLAPGSKVNETSCDFKINSKTGQVEINGWVELYVRRKATAEEKKADKKARQERDEERARAEKERLLARLKDLQKRNPKLFEEVAASSR